MKWNLLHRKIENFYKKFSSPVQNSSNRNRASASPTSICECYELQVDSQRKPNFKSLQLYTFQPHNQKRSRGISLSKESFENEPDYHESPEELILNLPRTRISLLYCLRIHSSHSQCAGRRFTDPSKF